MCVVWHSGRGVCVERYMIGVRAVGKRVGLGNFERAG